MTQSTPTLSVATTVWSGGLFDGRGLVNFDSSDAARLPVTWLARKNGTSRAAQSTTPEELLAAAHTSCYSMAFAMLLDQAEAGVDTLITTAKIGFVAGTGITGVDLHVEVRLTRLPNALTIIELAREAKDVCPVSLALRVPITLTVTQL